jgi:tetratricopeptide (TPR) repeat protein
MYSFNYDTSDAFLERIRADVATAKRLAPADPFVLGTEASHLGWVENDLPRAHATFLAADAAGLGDSMLLSSYATVMERMGRPAEALALFERADVLDPANPFIIAIGAFGMSTLQRVTKAIAVIDRGIALYPERGYLKLVRAQIVFVNTGQDAELRRELDLATRQLPLPGLLDLNFRVLLNVRAYDDLQRLLDAIPDREVRVVPGPGGGGMFLGVGQRPIAQFRGWLALLRGETAAAARHGIEVLEFVGRQTLNPRNAWFLHWLTADGHTFLGQHDRAIAAARSAMEARPSAGDTFGAFVVLCVARNLAWCGAASDALTLLESIFAAGNTRYPAIIPRDPILTTSLAKEDRFHALVAQLEAQLKANNIA